MLYPRNFEDHLIEMPFVANPGKATADLIGEMLTELARPLSDCGGSGFLDSGIS